jgi:hypothetical protein
MLNIKCVSKHRTNDGLGNLLSSFLLGQYSILMCHWPLSFSESGQGSGGIINRV